MKVPFILSDAERASPLWEKLTDRFEERIAALSRENENPDFDAVQTALRRGRIQAFRELLALDKRTRSEELSPEA